MRVATVAYYGVRDVEYIQVVISEEPSGEIITYKLWNLKKKRKSPDKVADEIVKYVVENGAEKMYQIDTLLAPRSERCPHCGRLMLRKVENMP